MKLRFTSFTTAYFNNIGKEINEWIDRQENPIDMINWRCCGGDERTTVVICYYDYSEDNNVSV